MKNTSELIRPTGTSAGSLPAEAQLQPWQQQIHHDTANTATKNMTPATHCKTLCTTESHKSNIKHGIRYEYIYCKLDAHRLTV